MQTLLIIDDDQQLAELTASYLEKHRFTVNIATDGVSGVTAFNRLQPDLVILDVMMPQMDGFEVLREIRKQHDTPVLMLTGRDADIDRILGLELGSDDYVVKPIDPREILARVKAILRRTQVGRPAHSTNAALQIDRPSMKVQFAGHTVPLTSTEYQLLDCLQQHHGEIVSREALSEQALGRRNNPFDRSLDVHISRIRQKLQDAGAGSDLIKTIRGRGYVLLTEGEA